MIMAHMGHPWYEECIVVARKQPNVYCEVSAIFYRPWQFYNALMSAVEYGAAHKLLFGSDYPQITPDRWLADFAAAPFRDEVREKILWRNANRLLGCGFDDVNSV